MALKRRRLLLVLPQDANPYQELLYGPMRIAHPEEFRTLYWKRRPWVGIPHFFLFTLWAAARGSRIAHVHWLAWDVRVNIPFKKRISGASSRGAIWWLKLLHFRIVWTVHNVLPHEQQTGDDLAVARLLGSSAKSVIVHSDETLASLSTLGIRRQSAIVIPQGSYVGLYGSPPSLRDARQRLNLPESGRILLYFGHIRSYKGIPQLLAAWQKSTPNSTLMIVGSSSDDELTTRITHAAISDPTIEARIQFIPDSEVATYFGAADAVCLPFQRITTSSSALLALSFGKPLIAPRIGALKDLPLDTGFLYGDDTDRTLPGALQLFFDASDEELWTRGANGLAYAKSLSWAGIAERTYDLYSNILA